MRRIWWAVLVLAVGCAKHKKPADSTPDAAPLASLPSPDAATLAVTATLDASLGADAAPPPRVLPKVVKGIAAELVGSYQRSDEGIADFVSIALMADGTFEADQGIVCASPPCASTLRGKWTSSDFTGTTKGTLTLREVTYQVELLPAPRQGMRLSRPASGHDRARAATFEVGGRLGRKP